ncbi:MAG: DUF4870 domain-containing protein [Candidatus Omnitrophica bacterium]|nr:DUF4870 domain-containing protein [Candidatus Omnitrophota bacterium]
MEQIPEKEQPFSHPQMDPRQAQNWVVGIHLSQLAVCVGLIFGNLIVPFALWLIKRHESPLIDSEGKKVLNFQISMSIYVLLAGLMCFILIGFVVVPILVLTDIICIIIGSVQTSKGIDHKYPLSIEFLK